MPCAIMRFVRVMSYVLVPLGTLLFISQLRASPNWQEALSGTVAGVVTMVPEGLVLLTSVAMAVAVVRLGKKRALVQEMPAVEGLARVDVICVDKTGTLTEPGMAVQSVHTLDEGAPVLNASELQTGKTVRIRSLPFAGAIGTIALIRPGQTRLANGLRASAADIRLENDRVVTIPLANLDVLE